VDNDHEITAQARRGGPQPSPAGRDTRRNRGRRTLGGGVDSYGRWLVLDTQRFTGAKPQICLLSVGAERSEGAQLFDGPSITSRLPSAVRDLLVPRISKAIESKLEVSDTTTLLGSAVRTRIIPLSDPFEELTDSSGAMVSVTLAYYGDRDQPVPSPPQGGAWHWKIPRTGSPRAYWSDEVFKLFGFELPPRIDAEYPKGIWLDGAMFFSNLIPPEWRDEVYTSYDHVFDATNDDLIVRTYQRPHGDIGMQTLRMCGRAYPQSMIARGYTGAIPQPANLDRGAGTEPLGATILASTTSAIFVVNLRALHVYTMSEPFRELGLTIGAEIRKGNTLGGALPIFDLCHPDDRPEFERLLHRASREPMVRLPAMQIRLATLDGGYRVVDVAPAGVSNPGSQSSHLVVCYVSEPSQGVLPA